MLPHAWLRATVLLALAARAAAWRVGSHAHRISTAGSARARAVAVATEESSEQALLDLLEGSIGRGASLTAAEKAQVRPPLQLQKCVID